MLYQDISIVRAKAQIRKKDNTPIVVCTVKELKTSVIMTRKQWNNYTQNLPIEDGAGLCGSVLFIEVGEELYGGGKCDTANSLVKDFALVTGSKGMQQVALTNASIAVMSRYSVANVPPPTSFKPEDFIKFISDKPADTWLTILMDDHDLNMNQANLVCVIHEKNMEAKPVNEADVPM